MFTNYIKSYTSLTLRRHSKYGINVAVITLEVSLYLAHVRARSGPLVINFV